MAVFDFKTATPATSGVTTNYFWFGAASQAATTPSILSMGALTTFLSTATLGAGTITTSQPLTLTQTWNAAGVVFAGLSLNMTDTASQAASLLVDLKTSNASKFFVTKAGAVTQLGSLNLAADASTLTLGASADVILARDAANTLAQRNGVNAQAFRVYKTFTDASNYGRFTLDMTSSPRLVYEVLGTGSAQNMEFGNASTGGSLGLVTGNTSRWVIDASGHLVCNGDNTYDIGASGATRPRTIYAGTNVEVGAHCNVVGDMRVSAGSAMYWQSRTVLQASAASNLLVSNTGVTDFGLFQFGGTTNSFPAIKRSSAALAVRVASDDADAAITALSVGARPSLATPAAASAVAAVTMGSALVGVYWGTGSPNTALTAPKGSLYMNTTGGGVNDRAFINTDGSTAWTAIVTVG